MEKAPAVTIQDVARLAGVGVGTASRALSGNGYVARDTRARILEAAEKLKFRPSSAARALSKGQTDAIGIVTPRSHGGQWGSALAVAEKIIRASGRHMIVASSYDGEEEGKALAFLRERGCDGILMLGAGLNERDLVLATEGLGGKAFVDRKVGALTQDCFTVDHAKSAAMVADYLVGRGHETFAVITGPRQLEAGRGWFKGFAERIAQAGFDIDERLVLEGSYMLDNAREAAAGLMATGLPFTALFCENDEMAAGAKMELDRAGRKVEVFGYEDTAPWNQLELGINTVAVPIESIVANACAHLLNSCYGGNRPVTHEFETQLVIRAQA